MELNIFIKELESALKERGIPEETALKHVSNLKRTFTNDDLSEIEAITSTDEINDLADSISVILNKNKKTTAVEPRKTSAVPAASAATTVKKPIPQNSSYDARKVKKTVIANQKPKIDDDFLYEYEKEQKASPKGLGIFWGGLILTLPITLFLLAIIFGSFIAVFAALIGLIIAGVAVLIALVAAGSGISLIGIIFGITQLFSFAAAGIYEIGLGVMVAGAVLFVGVLIYNFSVRLLPWLISLVGNLLGFVCSKLKTLFFFIRRECYKL
ncbi:MAG: hypothetical protein E7672_05500 [Ruminococcaceae bacterium]|nr:hypothetical protein [Oscillospiraceae bacterium]